MSSQRLRGLYAVTPDWDDTARLLEVTEVLLRGGVRLLQYRNKHAAPSLRRAQAEALSALARRHGVPCLINDDPALALAVGADGAHVGREDGGVGAARAKLGGTRIIGASCYNEIARANEAVRAGADYIAFGAMFTSPTKPAAVRAPLDLLGEARRLHPQTPLCCIGGITLDTAPVLIDAGADLLAVITDLYEAADPESRAGAYARLFEPRNTP